MEEKEKNDDDESSIPEPKGDDPAADDEPTGEDPAVAAYREFITKMDDMESAADEPDVIKATSNLKPSEEGVGEFSARRLGEHAPLLLGSSLQEEDEISGLHGPGRRIHTPPPPGNPLSMGTGGLTTGLAIPSIADPVQVQTKRRTGLVEGPLFEGRTSPQTGKGCPSPRLLRSGRVSPHFGTPESDHKIAPVSYTPSPRGSKGSIHSIIVQPAQPEITSKDKKWTEANGNNVPNGNSVADDSAISTGVKPQETRKKSKDKLFFRAFRERASQENFALYGLLTPALCLVPNVDGHDTLTQTFTGLQGENRELKLAAAHIDDAINGRGKYGKARAFFTSKKGQFCFKVQNNRWFHYLVLFASVVHMLLIFFEPPRLTGSTHWLLYVLTPLCLLVYAMDVAVYIGFLTWSVFWTLDENKFIRAEFIFLCMYIIDFLVLVIQEILQMRLVQVFRGLRAAIIICKLKNVGHILDVVMSIVIKLGKVFLIVVVFILMFSAVGVHLLEDDYHTVASDSNCTDTSDDTYTGAFDHLGIAALRLFVLLTTENYPDLMTQAFSVDRLSAFYFILYILIGVFFLTAILLAIIVDSYWEFAKKQVKKERARERAELAKAWNLLDPLGNGSLPNDDEKLLKLFGILRPQNSEEMNMQLIQYLDGNEDGQVDSLEWTIRLNDTLGFEFEQEDTYISRSHPKWVNVIKRSAQKIAFSNVFNFVILILIFIHCILFCVHWYNMTYNARLIIQIIKSVIVAIFMIEVVFRVISDWRLTLLQVIEVFDICLIVVAVVFNLLWYAPSLREFQAWFAVISGLAVAFRIGLNSNETKRVVILFYTRIFPVMFDLIILVFIIVYFYAVLGFEAFYNKTPAENHSSPYCGCGLGFDNFWCSLLAVFQIVTTSNWHDLMNSAMVSTSDWACLYFVSCYVAINLVVMNLFVAIAIEAFNKLGTERNETETQPTDESRTRRESFADSAKTFFNNLFESSRVPQKEPVHVPSSSGSAINKASPRMRRTSRAMSIAGLTPMPPLPIAAINNTSLVDIEDDEEEEEEDYTGLTPQEKKKKQFKKRMQAKKKKKNPKTKTVVVTAYKGTKDQELDLTVGEEVAVLQKTVKVVTRQDDWWEGTIRGKRGWFPASHVKDVKRNVLSPQVQRKDIGHQQHGGNSRPQSPSPKPAWSREDRPLPADKQGSPMEASNTPHLTMQEVTSATRFKPKLKVRNTGSWRKEILGDITVINPEELKELNKILKSGTAQASLKGTLSGTLKRKPTIMAENIIEEEEPEPVKPKTPAAPSRPVLVPPKINLERVPTMPLPEEDEEEEAASTQVVDTLTVDKPDVPTQVKKKRNKENNKDGEMPSWMLKFVETNKVTVSSDVKVDEDDVQPASSDDDTKTFPGIPKEKKEQVTEL